MFKIFKSNTRGFTLIEIIVALAILVMLAGFTITSLLIIPQTKMREAAQTIKSEFELTRDLAKTHGGDAVFSIQKVPEGLKVIRSGKNLNTEESDLNDAQLVLFYKETGDDKEYQLGEDDADNVVDSTLSMTFSQTKGAIIGPNMVDYIVISNGSKNFKFIIKQSTGMIYYDYELEEDEVDQNITNSEITKIQAPTFIDRGVFCSTITLQNTGSSIQPEINYDSRNIKIGGEYRAINPGEYAITFTLKDPYSTEWVDGTTEPKTLTWIIE